MSLASTLSFIANHPLSRSRATRNLDRFIGWQLLSLLWHKPVRFKMANEAKLFAVRGLHGATGNLYVGLHEFEEMALTLHLLRSGDLFVDAGANIGSYTILAASVGAHVHAFEPGAKARDWLERNIRLNGFDTRVCVHADALSDRNGSAPFISTWGARNRLAATGDCSVPTTMLDIALGSLQPTLLKVDVEDGAEALLRGAQRLLARDSLLCVMGELTSPAALATLAAHGLEPHAYEPKERRLRPLSAAEANQRSGALFVRNLPLVERRLRSAEPFHVRGEFI